MENTVIVELYENISRCKFILLDYLISEEARRELGEPILHKSKNKYLFLQPSTRMYLKNMSLGFIGFSINKNTATLSYAYIFKSYRNKGLFKFLYNEFEMYCKSFSVSQIKVVSSMMALPIYEHYGFKISKKYKNCIHLYKKL